MAKRPDYETVEEYKLKIGKNVYHNIGPEEIKKKLNELRKKLGREPIKGTDYSLR